MSSIAALPSLNALQASFATSLASLTASSRDTALEDLRQVPAFSRLSSLNALVSQQYIARLVFKPSLHQRITERLSVFDDLSELRTLVALPSVKERLKAAALALELRHGVQIYSAMLVFSDRPDDLDVVSKSMSRALKDELNWPQSLTLETLGSFAVSTRKAFDVRGDHLTAEQRHDLMQIAARLNEVSADLCAFDPAQTMSPIQARKIATLVELLYGTGFGDDRWLDVSDSFRRLIRGGSKLDAAAREEFFRRFAALANNMLEEVKASYIHLFDPIGATPAFQLTGTIAPLSRHLAALGIT